MGARKKVTGSRGTKKSAPSKAKPKPKPKAKPKPKPKPKPKAKPKPKLKAKAAKPEAAKAKPKPKAKAKAKARVAPRRDATGHLNPRYAADLRARSNANAEDSRNANAFLRKARSHDSLAEELGEDAVSTMTSGEDQSDRIQDLEVEEERGGPFVTTTGREEFAGGTDKSNPFDATREPFPTS